MKLTLRQLQSICFASSDVTNEGINALYVGKGVTVATDGYRLCVVTPPEQIGAELPPILVRRRSVGKCLNLLSATKQKDVQLRPNSGAFYFRGEEDPTFQVRAETVDKKYPDWTNVLPNESDWKRFRVDARYLQSILKFILQGADRKYLPKTIDFWFDPKGLETMGANKGIYFESEDADGTRIKYLLMPVRIPENEIPKEETPEELLKRVNKFKIKESGDEKPGGKADVK